jgi:ubiquinone/menaquinone biosynthesis C-methylase UbiE
MSGERKPSTSGLNGRLWGARAQDWANLNEVSLRPVYEAVLTRLSVGNRTRYLDIGCGSGLATQLAANRGAEVYGIDAAEALLAIARARTPKGEFRHGDLEALHYEDATFDAVTGFNSFQYAANPEIALRQAKRVCKPEGAIAIVTWGKPEGMQAASMVTALRPLMPPPPPGAPGPFALSDETALRNFATSAGLKAGEIFDVEAIYAFPDKETAIRAWNSSGVAARAMENTSEQAVSEAHANAMAPYRQSDGSYRFSGTFRCLMARP